MSDVCGHPRSEYSLALMMRVCADCGHRTHPSAALTDALVASSPAGERLDYANYRLHLPVDVVALSLEAWRAAGDAQ